MRPRVATHASDAPTSSEDDHRVSSSGDESSSARAHRDAARPQRDWYDAFIVHFIDRATDGRAYARDDVLHFVRLDRSTFVRRWRPGMVVDAGDEAYAAVDWRETTKLNACAQSAYEVVVGQFEDRNRDDLATTVVARAYASPHYTELSERGTPTGCVGTYPLVCFTFDEPVMVDARAGRMLYVTLRRKRDGTAAEQKEDVCGASGRGDSEDSDIVFSTHAALSDEPATRLGRALMDAPTSPARSPLRFLPKVALGSPLGLVRGLLGMPKSPESVGKSRVRPGVELYPAGGGAYVLRSIIAPCADIVHDIMVHHHGPFLLH